MTTYNIHPLALSPTHYLLARAGFVLAPLRVEEVEPVGNIQIFLDGSWQHTMMKRWNGTAWEDVTFG